MCNNEAVLVYIGLAHIGANPPQGTSNELSRNIHTYATAVHAYQQAHEVYENAFFTNQFLAERSYHTWQVNVYTKTTPSMPPGR